MLKKFLLVTTALCVVWPDPANAGPLIGAVAATAGSIFSAGGLAAVAKFTMFGGLLTGWGAVAAQFAIRAVLGYALNALSSKPAPALNEGYTINVNQLGTVLPHQIIYGETRVGGAVFYQGLTNSDTHLHRMIAFAGHEIESYEKIFINDTEVTLDGSGNVTTTGLTSVRIKKLYGTDDQAADADAVADIGEWTTNHRARGIAYLYVRFTDKTAFPNGVPVISAVIRGKKVEDPRTATTAWSDNPALCIRDYLLSGYGLEESVANINDTLFSVAADECEVQVSGVDKYTCNGSFALDSSPEDVIRNLLSSMGGIFWNYAGQWAIQAAVYQAPEIELDQDDLRGNLTVATRHSRRDNFNTVVGAYKGEETDYQRDNYTEISSPFYLTQDNEIRASSELNLFFTDTENMARRIALTYIRRNRLQITVQGEFGIRAMDLKIGDNVMLTVDHMNWSQKVFEVVDWRLIQSDMDIRVSMMLREMAESVFTGVVGEIADESGNTLTDESGNTLVTVIA